MKADSFQDRLIGRFGGSYLLLVIALAQIIGFVGTALAGIMVQTNAEFSPSQAALAASTAFALLVIGNAILLIWVRSYTSDAREQLSHWAKHASLARGTDREFKAWRQITSVAWKYGAAAGLVTVFILLIPLLVILSALAGISQDQVVYVLFGILVSGISTVSIMVLMIENLLRPARKILLPEGFEAQIANTSGFRIRTKFLVTVLGLIFISVLLIAPIGYHQTVTVLYREIGSTQVLNALQVQSAAVALITLALGFWLAYLLTNSISNPIQGLITTFAKVEQGDLSQRVSIDATDEIGELAIYFNRMINRLEELQRDLEMQVEARTAHLQAINEVGRVAASILDPEELLSRVVNLITDEFGYYYSALFLVDPEKRFAELRDATGEAGKVLRQSKHRLEINDRSMVGRAILARQAQVAQDVGEKSIRFNNPLLPYTRSEIALPLLVGDKVLGALDVQSTQEAAFGEQDIDTLQNMANQVAVALENAHLFQEAQRSIQELRNIQKKYLRESWDVTSLPEGEIVLAIGDEPESGGRVFEFPVALREEVIGKITITSANELTQEESNWIQAIITQAALALENARLLEESQTIAMREKYVTEITNKIWSANTIDGIMQVSLRELGQILDASEAVIELRPESK